MKTTIHYVRVRREPMIYVVDIDCSTRTEYAGVKTLSPDHVTHCPICGQKLPGPDERQYGRSESDEEY